MRKFTVNEFLDSAVQVADLTQDELARLSYGAKYFEFGWGYDETEARVAKLNELRKAVLKLEAEKTTKEKASRKAQKEAQRKAREKLFRQAAETDKPVILHQYQAPCNNPNEECDVDDVVVYAMPDGSTKTVRNHSW